MEQELLCMRLPNINIMEESDPFFRDFKEVKGQQKYLGIWIGEMAVSLLCDSEDLS